MRGGEAVHESTFRNSQMSCRRPISLSGVVRGHHSSPVHSPNAMIVTVTVGQGDIATEMACSRRRSMKS